MAAAMDQAHIYPDGGGYRLRHAIQLQQGRFKLSELYPVTAQFNLLITPPQKQ